MITESAEVLLKEAYKKSYESLGENFLSSTSIRKFDPIRTVLANLTELENSTDGIYIVSAGTRPGNLQVRFKQGNRAGRHTPLGVGFIQGGVVIDSDGVDSLFNSLKENVARNETSYDALMIVEADGESCNVLAIFSFSNLKLKNVLEQGFPNAQVRHEALTHGGGPNPLEDSVYIVDSEVEEKALKLLHQYKNIILEGSPGSGKTEFANHLALKLSNDPALVISLQFHPAYSYEEFVLGWRPDEEKGGWSRQTGLLPEICSKALENSDRSYVLVIDELNRAEIVAVFGEAFTLIDASKRSPKWSIPLQGSGSEQHLLHVPENLFVIGTINSADRTAHSLDHALRRRFAFLQIPPNFGSEIQNLMRSRGIDQQFVEIAIERVQRINKIISSKQFTLGDGYLIAHGYLIPSFEIADSAGWWNDIRDNRLIPTLEAYFFDDIESLSNVQDILNEPIE